LGTSKAGSQGIVRGARSTFAGDWCDFSVHWKATFECVFQEWMGRLVQCCEAVGAFVAGT
jgi:hypothetical protein